MASAAAGTFECSLCFHPNTLGGGSGAAGSCATCVNGDLLCDACFGRHASGHPRFAGHSFVKVGDEVTAAEKLLRRLGLTSAVSCARHLRAKLLDLACAECGTQAMCTDCVALHSTVHPSHSLRPVTRASSAADLRAALNAAVCAPVEGCNAVAGESNALEACARHKAISAAATLEQLDAHAEAARVQLAANRDSIYAAVEHSYAALAAELEAAVATKRAALEEAVLACDEALEGAAAAAATMTEAAAVLADPDIAAHAAAILQLGQAAHSAVVSLPLVPREGAYLGVSAVTPADAKAAISRLIGRISTSPSELPAHVHNPHCRAGCGLARTTFNHEPATSGRVLAAAKAGDTAALQAALYDGCSTEEADELGRTALILASIGGHTSAVEVLLNAGADTNAADAHSALHLAASAFAAAISKGAPQYNAGDHGGCRDRYAAAAEAVLSQNAWQNFHGERGALQAAVAQARGESPKLGAWTMRHALDRVLACWDRAGEAGGLDVVSRGRQIPQQGVACNVPTHPRTHPPQTGCTALHWAARKGHLGVVRALLRDPRTTLSAKNADGKTALALARASGNADVVELLGSQHDGPIDAAS